MIREVEIKNFRGIRSCKITDLNQINLFIGKFGSGKSTILESVYFLKSLSPIGIKSAVDKILGRRTERGKRREERRRIESSYLWYRHNPKNTLMVKPNFDSGSLKIEMGNPEILSTPKGSRPFTRYDVGCKISYGEKEATSEKIMTTMSFTDFRYKEGVKDRLPSNSPIEPSFVSNIIMIDEDYKRKIQNVESSYLNPIKWRQLDIQFTEMIQEVFEDIKGYEFMTYSPGIQESRSTFVFPDSKVFIDEVSDGARVGVVILATAYLSSDIALLIEEPENHAYAKSLINMISKLVELANKNNLQLFVTTHRPEVVAHFVKLGRDKVKVFCVERTNGEVGAVPSEWNNIKILIDLGCDIGILAKGFEKYVITEGLMDKYIVETSITKLKNMIPEDLWMTVISCRGKDVMKEIVKALLPTGKAIFVLKDRDRKTDEETVTSVIDSVKSLQEEGYSIQEDTKTIRLLKGIIKAEIRKDRIFPLGQDIEFEEARADFKTHTMDDYVLDMITKEKALRERFGVNHDELKKYIQTNTCSKDVLSKILDYTPETVSSIIEMASAVNDSLVKVIESITQ